MKEILEFLSGLKEKGIRASADSAGTAIKLQGNVKDLHETERKFLQANKPQLLEMLRKDPVGIPVVSGMNGHVLSSSQQRLWVMSRFEEAAGAYNVYTISVFQGELSEKDLEFSFGCLLQRHEILRTVFRENEDGEVRQYILSQEELKFEINYQHTENDITDVLREKISRHFDLCQGPLINVTLCRTAPDQWMFIMVMHHIICDGWSLDILIKELMFLYDAAVGGRQDAISPLRIQYKDYAAWQQAQLHNGLLHTHKTYWLEKLCGELPVLELPVDKPRRAIKRFRGASVSRRMDAVLTQKFKTLVQEQECTLFMGMLSALNVLLHRYSGQNDIIIGIPVTGRIHPDLAGQVGFYVNTLALRCLIPDSSNYKELLRQVKTMVLEGYSHQSYPFDKLIDDLQLQRDLSRNTMFDVMLVMPDHHGGEARARRAGKLNVQPYNSLQYGMSGKFDLVFNVTDTGDGLELNIEFNSDLFNESTIQRMADHLSELLCSIAEAPDMLLSGLEYLKAEEKAQLHDAFNNTRQLYPAGKSVVRLFSEQAAASPDASAIVHGELRLSYGEVNEIADRLSRYLGTGFGVTQRDLVAVQMGRSEWLVIAILGVLKTGAAYLPVDPEYPAERIDYMMKDSNCKILLDDAFLQQFRDSDSRLSHEGMAWHDSSGDDLAYVIYTSGSTGQPKGVMTSHKALLNLCYWHLSRFSIVTTDRSTLYAGVGFDAAVWEMFPYLIAGACIYIIPDSIRLDMQAMADFYEKNKITVSFLPTQIGEQFMAWDNSSLRYLLLGGDKLNSWTQKRYRIVNNYGPTENAVVTTSYEINSYQDDIPVGKPIANVSVYILDDKLGICGIGVIGEICIGGNSLSYGYLNRPALTAEKFIPDPFIPGERMYRTGDLGRWLPDGNIVFAGRKDEQLKVRGYRIEAGEIAMALESHLSVDKAVVMAVMNNQGDKELVAYILSATPLNAEDLRAYLSKSLPSWMVPQHFIHIAEIPLTANGKLDKKALPRPDPSVSGQEAGYMVPRNATEELLTFIWEEILGKQRIGVKDDFFSSGGNSLHVTKLVNRINKVFGVRIAIEQLFIQPILEQQAILITTAGDGHFVPIPQAAQQAAYPLSSAQKRIWALSQLTDGNVAYNMPGVYIFEGDIEPDTVTRAFDMLMRRHEILRTVFKEDTDGDVKQFVLSPDQAGFNIRYCDVRGEDEVSLHKRIEAETNQPFQLAISPLIRVTLFRTEDHTWVFTFVMHHIISDGWSAGILIREVLGYYDAYCSGHTFTLPPLSIQYKDYAVLQQQQLTGGQLLQQKEYWLKQLEGELPILDLWMGKDRPAIKTFNGDVISTVINATVFNGFKERCRENGATLFMGLLAALNTLLYKYTGQEDIIIGTPVAGREHADLDGQIGLYVNTLALRTVFEQNDSFQQLLGKVRGVTLGAYANQAYPFDELVDLLNRRWSASRNALFDVMISLQDSSMNSQGRLLQSQHLSIRNYIEKTNNTAKVDLSFDFVEEAGIVKLHVEYNTDVCSRSMVQQLVTHTAGLLAAISNEPHVALNKLSYLSETEMEFLLSSFNNKREPVAGEQNITMLIAQQANRDPDKIALCFEDTKLTYRELNEASNRLAHYLRTAHNVKPEELIGVLLPRTEWQIIALLGVLRSGAAYVPIDPEYPEERVQYLLKDANCRLLLDETVLGRFRELEHTYSGADVINLAGPGDLAYVMYTSGSTGSPKGVMIEHHSMLDYAITFADKFSLVPEDKIIQQSSISFDTHVEEIYPALISGSTILMTVNNGRSIDELKELIEVKGATVLSTTPLVINELCMAGFEVHTLRLLISGGDKFNAASVSGYMGKLEIFDSYGPTESTVCASFYKVQEAGSLGIIGTPLPNRHIMILNQDGRLQPVGVAGEICISGDGLARGYLYQPQLTAEKFVENPYSPGLRMYNTGDLGRWLPDGNILFVGRKDEQLKIRGYRIEPAEIEWALQTHPDIESAVCCGVPGRSGEKELVAYIVSRKSLSVTALRTFLGNLLPFYMVPACYVPLSALPLTPAGKLNRNALPLPAAGNTLSGKTYTAPRTEMEILLVAIWEELLGKEGIGVKDDFFELGGHSIKAAQLMSRINKATGVRINIQNIFQEPTIENIAAQVHFIRHQHLHRQERNDLVQIEI